MGAATSDSSGCGGVRALRHKGSWPDGLALTAAKEPKKGAPERTEPEPQAADRLRLHLDGRRRVLGIRPARLLRAIGELTDELGRDVCKEAAAVLGDGAGELEIRDDVDARAAVLRREGGLDRRRGVSTSPRLAGLRRQGHA